MTVNFGSNVWRKERTIINITGLRRESTHVMLEVQGVVGLAAAYSIPASLVLDIDVSDIVRMYQSGTFVITEYEENTVAATATRAWQVVGDISPRNVLIPEADLQDAEGGAPVLPPTRMLIQPAGTIAAECYFNTPNNWQVTGGATFDSDRTGIEITGDFNLMNRGATRVRTFKPQAVSGCLPYAIVTWRSFTGRTRTHVFEVIKQVSEAVNEQELLTIDNSFDVRKGRKDSLTLRLDGLDRYDMWYYGDLLLSSDVRVSPSESYGERTYKAQVVSNTVELPASDEGALGTIEIELNYARYDTV